MLKIGTVVRVIYPDYAAGILGKVLAQEETGRWVVELARLADESEPLLLSLEESDFEILNTPE